MTRFAWVFNLDADFELQAKTYNTPDKLKADLSRNGQAARALMGPEDAECALGIGPGFVGRAFCPTEKALSRMRAAGVVPEPHPAQAVLRRVNHRLFAHALGGGLADQHWIESRAALDVLLARPTPWLLKRPLSFAGRGQLVVSGSLTDKDDAWITASLRADGLIVEPFVAIDEEYSLHGFIWPDGRHLLGGLCVQTVSRGVYRSVRRDASHAHAGRLEAEAARVAAALCAAGYFGPFGIDAYTHMGGLCCLSEINARYTMAFAVGFSRPVHTLEL
jgi:phosphoribosylaminoimidazole carboxylase (NCAIR synthetase)